MRNIRNLRAACAPPATGKAGIAAAAAAALAAAVLAALIALPPASGSAYADGGGDAAAYDGAYAATGADGDPAAGLESVEGDFMYSVQDGCATITDYTGSADLLEIPAELGGAPVMAIGDFAFYGADCTAVDIPSTVVSIGEDAFANSALVSVEVPDTVKTVSKWAFYNCASLAQATLPDALDEVAPHLFDGCPLVSVDIPAKATAIGDYAFYDNAATFVEVPETVESIGAYALHSDVTERLVVKGAPALSGGAFYLLRTGSVIYLEDADFYETVYDEGASTYYSPYRSSLEVVGGEELAGDDRYGTAIAIAKRAFGEHGYADAEGVIVASGQNFPDALSAAALAGLLDYPILLAGPDGLSDGTASAIAGLTPSRVIVVGGTAAVPDAVETRLGQLFGTDKVERIAGEDRYATALAVYEAGRAEEGGWGDTAVVASGESFPDALSASAYAFAHKAPIFLSARSGLSAEVSATVSAGGFSQAIIAGGTAAVPASVETDLREALDAEDAALSADGDGDRVVRLAGDDRYGTSAAIAEYALSHGASRDRACVATGSNFPDALAGGVLAGRSGSVLLLADEGKTGHLASAFDAGTGYVGRVFFLGGTDSLPSTVRAAALKAAGFELQAGNVAGDAAVTASAGIAGVVADARER